MKQKEDRKTSGQVGPKPHNRSRRIGKAAGHAVSAKIHGKIQEEEQENAGVKAAHKMEFLAEKAIRKSADLLKRNPKVLLYVFLIFLLLVILQSCMSGALSIGNGILGAVGGTSYLADDRDIDEAELSYTQWEVDLELKAKNAESSHPGYDEYRYNIMNIGHNPYELMAYLTAKHNDFSFPEIEGILRGIFSEQYSLDFVAAVETRYRRESRTDISVDEGVEQAVTYEVEVPYDWHVMTVTLSSRSFSRVISPRLGAKEEKERYAVYLAFHGNRQLVGNPFDFNWLSQVSSYYGYRIHPVTGNKDCHYGVDISVAEGTPIRAGGNGTVIETGMNDGYGLTLLVDYGKGVSARYAHCSALLVQTGQAVKRGDVIALSGGTGSNTGSHLHMEVVKNGRFLNPLYFVDGTQGGAIPDMPEGQEIPFPGEPMDDPGFLALIAEAEKHLGKPYVFGSAGPSTFDCSGFIYYVFNHSGVKNVGRTTAQGFYNMSSPVSPGGARPGDLIFFHGTYSTPNTVTHIGLYVGNGMMVHAGNPVQYASINTNYWTQHFYAFGRLQ